MEIILPPGPGLHGAMLRNRSVIAGDPADDITNVPDGTGQGFPAGFHKATLGKVVFDTDGVANIATSEITLPVWAKWVSVIGHLTFPPQVVGSGRASVHLFRDDTPTDEAHYHNRIYYPNDGKTYVSVLGMTGWIPVLISGESWSIWAYQNTGAAVDIPSSAGPDVELWMSVFFRR